MPHPSKARKSGLHLRKEHQKEHWVGSWETDGTRSKSLSSGDSVSSSVNRRTTDSSFPGFWWELNWISAEVFCKQLTQSTENHLSLGRTHVPLMDAGKTPSPYTDVLIRLLQRNRTSLYAGLV